MTHKARAVRHLLIAGLVFSPRLLGAQGEPLGPEFRVNTHTTDRQQTPFVDVAASGDFVVVWTSTGQDGSLHGAFGQRYAASGTPLGPEFQVNTYTTGYQTGPSVEVDGSGRFVIAWNSVSQDGSSWGVFAQRYDAAGAPLGPEFRVNTFTTGFQGFSSIGSDPTGEFVIVWGSEEQDGSGFGVFGQRYSGAGSPVGSEFSINTFTTGDQGGPLVVVDSSGNFVVVWESYAQDGSDLGVFGRRYANTGAALGGEFRVNTYTTGNQLGPSLVLDSSDNFVVTWQSYAQDGSGWGIFGQRYNNTGTPLGPEFRVNTYTTGDQGSAGIAADAAGNFVIVWQAEGQDGPYPSYAVFAKRFANDGAPLGTEFRVNTHTANTQWDPSVAADPLGNFIVVWESVGQDGSISGIYGQRYGQIVPVELMNLVVD